MDEFLKSFTAWFKEKTSSSLHFTFIATYIAWHWKSAYILFIDDSLIEIEERLYLAAENIPFWFYVDNYFFLFFINFFAIVIITYLILYQIPKLSSCVHDKTLDFYYERLRTYQEKDKKHEEWKVENLKSTVGALEKQSKLLNQKEKIVKEINKQELTSTQKRWERQYSNKEITELDLENLHTLVYKNRGQGGELNPYAISKLDTAGLIKWRNDRYLPTEKGKYLLEKLPFISNY